jgi:hypothetical protein
MDRSQRHAATTVAIWATVQVEHAPTASPAAACQCSSGAMLDILRRSVIESDKRPAGDCVTYSKNEVEMQRQIERYLCGRRNVDGGGFAIKCSREEDRGRLGMALTRGYDTAVSKQLQSNQS